MVEHLQMLSHCEPLLLMHVLRRVTILVLGQYPVKRTLSYIEISSTTIPIVWVVASLHKIRWDNYHFTAAVGQRCWCAQTKWVIPLQYSAVGLLVELPLPKQRHKWNFTTIGKCSTYPPPAR